MEILVLSASVTTIPRSSVFKLVIVDDRVEPFHATHLTPLAVDGGASLRAAGEAWCTAQSIDAAACAESLFTATASQLRAPEAAESFGLGECASNAAAAESQRAAAMDDPSVACDDVGACDCADASHVFNGQRCIAAAEAPAWSTNRAHWSMVPGTREMYLASGGAWTGGDGENVNATQLLAMERSVFGSVVDGVLPYTRLAAHHLTPPPLPPHTATTRSRLSTTQSARTTPLRSSTRAR